jgi:hypothetical protein
LYELDHHLISKWSGQLDRLLAVNSILKVCPFITGLSHNVNVHEIVGAPMAAEEVNRCPLIEYETRTPFASAKINRLTRLGDDYVNSGLDDDDEDKGNPADGQ